MFSFVAVERGLTEVRKLGIEQQLWEASRKEIDQPSMLDPKAAAESEASSWWSIYSSPVFISFRIFSSFPKIQGHFSRLYIFTWCFLLFLLVFIALQSTKIGYTKVQRVWWNVISCNLTYRLCGWKQYVLDDLRCKNILLLDSFLDACCIRHSKIDWLLWGESVSLQ